MRPAETYACWTEYSRRASSFLHLRFLASVGEVIYLPVARGGKSIVVLDIPWLCKDIIGAILSPYSFSIDKVQSKNGLVPRSGLERVFRGKPVGDIIHILVGLELCFSVEVDGLFTSG